jgi:hypothetical protein
MRNDLGSSGQAEPCLALELCVRWGDTPVERQLLRAGALFAGPPGTAELPAPSRERFQLVQVDGPRATLTLPDGVIATVTSSAGAREATGHALLGRHERASFRLDALTYELRFVDAPAELPASARLLDAWFSRSLAVSMLLAAFGLGAVAITPVLDPLSDALAKLPELRVKAKTMIVPKKALALEPSTLRRRSDEPVRTAVRARSSAEKRQQTLRAGLLGAFEGLESALGGPGLGAGITSALGALGGGPGVASANGVGGLGSRTIGPGGGGPGLGLGGLTGGPGGRGPGALPGAGGRPHGPTIVPCGHCVEEVGGGLPKEVIGKVIRQHQNEVRYCYEKSLQSNPSLAGKVAVRFVIGGTGSVTEAELTEDGVGAEVGACVAERVRRWRFPEPKDGGEVVVTYPWVLRNAGE